MIPSRKLTTKRGLLHLSHPCRRNVVIQWQNMRQRPNRSDGQGVDLSVASRVVPSNVVKLRCRPERGLIPVQIAHPSVDSRVSRPDVANVALEVLNVDRIEADERDESVAVRIGVLNDGMKTYSLISASVMFLPK